VTGVALSQGGCEAVRAMSNVKVLCVNGDVKSSEETVFKTMCPTPNLPLALALASHQSRTYMLLNDPAIDVCYAHIPKRIAHFIRIPESGTICGMVTQAGASLFSSCLNATSMFCPRNG
jgi:hypothetical protein